MRPTFIELTSPYGEPILICLNHILYLEDYPDHDHLRIQLTSGGFVDVAESYKTVKEMILCGERSTL